MTTLERTSLREQAARGIRSAIISGELEQGAIFSAASLARRFGVSPTPVREAMHELVSAGLVEPVGNRGFRIMTVSERDLDEIFQLRLMLEVPSARLVVEQASDGQLDEIERTVSDFEAAANAGDIPAFLLADRRFHLGLAELTRNRRLVELIARLRDQTRLEGLPLLAEQRRLNEAVEEHRQILAALRARDASQAENLMRSHLRHVRGSWAGRSEEPGNPVTPR